MIQPFKIKQTALYLGKSFTKLRFNQFIVGRPWLK